MALTIGLAVAPGGLGAQVGTDERPAPQAALPATSGDSALNGPRPTVRPTRADVAPVIDGRLDDPIWRTATRITGLSQQRPLDGAPPTERTNVWVAYDSENIYFAFEVHYSDRSIMRATRTDRDRIGQDDLVSVYFDTFMDGQRVYEFDVNAYNVQGDGILGVNSPGGSSAAIPRADRSWNTIFHSATEVVADGFTAEMAIPYKSLRYPSRGPGEPHRWGFQLVREIKGKNNEQLVWAPMSRSEANFFVQMGYIEGMTDLGTNRNIEIMPQFTAIQVGAIDPAQAAFVTQKTQPEVGVNVKYGVTSNLTADFTVNPDFSQVETDSPQIEVNRRFPILFSELRPFFVEGAEIFSISGPVTFVHTRTIVDPMFGAKLTGKVGPFAVGVVGTDDRAPGRVDDPSDPAFEQSAKTLIARARYDLYSQSTLGAVFTNREFLDSHSRLGGVDANFRLSRTLSTSFRAVGSWNQDLARQATDGHMLDARVGWNGQNVGWTASGYQISPDFNTEVGFVRRRDERVLAGDLRYTFFPESWILNWRPRVAYSRSWTFEDTLQDEELNADLSFEFDRNISFGAGFTRAMERFQEIDFDKDRFAVNAGADVGTGGKLRISGNFAIGDEVRRISSPFLGGTRDWGLSARVRPFPRVDYSLGVTSSRLTDPRNDDAEVFDITILRGAGTLQLTDRLTTRTISEYDTFTRAVALNLLFTYRVSAGTVLYTGYTDRLQQGNLIRTSGEQLFFTDEMQRTNRAFFVKFQYLFRY